jgi:hypothetical protein
MYTRKQALAQAKQIRLCPPLHVRKDRHQQAEVMHHLSICPYCSMDSIEALEAQDALTIRIPAGYAASPLHGEEAAAKGQIRYIQNKQAVWRDGYHYNAPMVVVMTVNHTIADDILVAQLYDDNVLAAPGDLILSSEQTGAGDLFVECWNTYTLRACHLGSVVGHLEPYILTAIARLEQDPLAQPQWAQRPMPLLDHDPRVFFRNMEVEVAFSFGVQAAGELMTEYEASAEKRTSITPDYLREDLSAVIPGLRVLSGPASVEDILATARFPDEMLPMAASVEEGKRVVGNRVAVHNGRISALTPINIEIFDMHEPADGLAGFSGKISPAIQVPTSRMHFRFAESDTTIIEPKGCTYNAATGYFTVTFGTSSTDWKKLRLAVIDEL